MHATIKTDVQNRKGLVKFINRVEDGWPPLTQSAPEDKIIYNIRIASFLLRETSYL